MLATETTRRALAPMIERVARLIPRHTKHGLLRADDLADVLGIDRAEVMRHIKNLRSRGVDIPPTRSGHRTGPTPDARLDGVREAIPRFTTPAGRLRTTDLAESLGLTPRQVGRLLARMRRDGEPVPNPLVGPSADAARLARETALALDSQVHRLTSTRLAREAGVGRSTAVACLREMRRAGEIRPLAGRGRPGPRPESTARRRVREAVDRLVARGIQPTSVAVAVEAGIGFDAAKRMLGRLRQLGIVPAYSPPPRPTAPAPPTPRRRREPAPKPTPTPRPEAVWLPTPEEIEAAKTAIVTERFPPSPAIPGPPETWPPAAACRLYTEEWRSRKTPGFMADDQLGTEDVA